MRRSFGGYRSRLQPLLVFQYDNWGSLATLFVSIPLVRDPRRRLGVQNVKPLSTSFRASGPAFDTGRPFNRNGFRAQQGVAAGQPEGARCETPFPAFETPVKPSNSAPSAVVQGSYLPAIHSPGLRACRDRQKVFCSTGYTADRGCFAHLFAVRAVSTIGSS